MEILKSIISKKFGKEVSAIPEHGNSLLLILSIYKIQTTSYIDSLQHQLTSNKVAVHLETYIFLSIHYHCERRFLRWLCPLTEFLLKKLEGTKNALSFTNKL